MKIRNTLLLGTVLLGTVQPLISVHASEVSNYAQVTSRKSEGINVSTNFDQPTYLNSNLAITFNISTGNGIKVGDKIQFVIPKNLDLEKTNVNGLDSKYGDMSIDKSNRTVTISFNQDLNAVSSLNFVLNLSPSAVGTGTIQGTYINNDGSSSQLNIQNNQYNIQAFDPLDEDNWIISADSGTLTNDQKIFDGNYLGSHTYLPNQTSMLYNIMIDPSGKQSHLTGRKVNLTPDTREVASGSSLNPNEIWISNAPYEENPSYTTLAESGWTYAMNSDGSIDINVPDGTQYTHYAIVLKVGQKDINKQANATATATATGNSEDGIVIPSQEGITLWGNFQTTNSKGFIPKINVADTLTLTIGSKIDSLEQWLLNQETASDYEDGDLTNKVTLKDSEQLMSAWNEKKIGTYPVTYTVTDSDGNITSKIVNVILKDSDPIKAADVTVQYLDTKGNRIAPDLTKSGNIGDSYQTEQQKIDGYTFKEVKGSETGKFTNEAQTVTYIYTKDSVKAGNVTAKYVDTDGHNVASDEVKSGNIGEDYNTEKKTVDGYTFKEVKGNENGKFTNKAQEVIYVYTKNIPVPAKPDNHNSNNIVQPVNQKSTQDRANNSSTKNRSNLPNTAAKNAILGMIIGIVVLSVTLGTIDWKRRKM